MLSASTAPACTCRLSLALGKALPPGLCRAHLLLHHLCQLLLRSTYQLASLSLGHTLCCHHRQAAIISVPPILMQCNLAKTSCSHCQAATKTFQGSDPPTRFGQIPPMHFAISPFLQPPFPARRSKRGPIHVADRCYSLHDHLMFQRIFRQSEGLHTLLPCVPICVAGHDEASSTHAPITASVRILESFELAQLKECLST